MDDATGSLTFDAAAGKLCAALRWVYETCERLDAAESECLSLQLAVEEVSSNLIEYGYGGRGGPTSAVIHWGGSLGGDPVKGDMVVTICTDHHRFTPTPHRIPISVPVWRSAGSGGDAGTS